MYVSLSSGLRACSAGRRKKQLCFFLAVIFLIGIVGNLSGQKNLSLVARSTGQAVLQESNRPAVSSETAALSAVESGGRIDDFHVSVSNRRSNTASEEAAREIVFVLLAALLLSGLAAAESHRRAFDEKRLPVFRVVIFIHRTDGKKRILF